MEGFATWRGTVAGGMVALVVIVVVGGRGVGASLRVFGFVVSTEVLFFLFVV